MPGATAEDWQALVDLAQSEGRRVAYLVDGEPHRLPADVQDMLELGAEVALKVWPVPDVLAIFRPYQAEQIDFDVDLRELQGQQRLDVLCRFMRHESAKG